MSAVIEIQETMKRVAIAISALNSPLLNDSTSSSSHMHVMQENKSVKSTVAKKKAALTCEILRISRQLIEPLDHSLVVVDVDADCGHDELSRVLHLLNSFHALLIQRFALDENRGYG